MLCSTSSAAPALAQGGGLTEDEFVAEVLRAGLVARIAAHESALARAEAVGVGSWANPRIAWERESVGRRGAERSTQDIFALSLPIVLSGRLGLERAAARTGAEAAAIRRSRALSELRHEAVNRFHDVLTAARRRQLLLESSQAVRQLADSIAARERAGDASGYDRLRVTVEAARIADEIAAATAREKAARASALALLPEERATLPELVGTLERPAHAKPLADVPSLVSGSVRQRADLQALRLEAQAAETARRAAARGLVPELTLSGGVQLLDAGRPGATSGYVAGVELPLPVFQRHQGEKARAASRRDLAAVRAASLEREIRLQTAVAHEQSTAVRARLEAYRKDVLGPALELRRIAGAAYRGGASDLLVLVDAERAAREAQQGAVELAREVIRADSDLLLLSGVTDDPEKAGTP